MVPGCVPTDTCGALRLSGTAPAYSFHYLNAQKRIIREYAKTILGLGGRWRLTLRGVTSLRGVHLDKTPSSQWAQEELDCLYALWNLKRPSPEELRSKMCVSLLMHGGQHSKRVLPHSPIGKPPGSEASLNPSVLSSAGAVWLGVDGEEGFPCALDASIRPPASSPASALQAWDPLPVSSSPPPNEEGGQGARAAASRLGTKNEQETNKHACKRLLVQCSCEGGCREDVYMGQGVRFLSPLCLSSQPALSPLWCWAQGMILSFLESKYLWRMHPPTRAPEAIVGPCTVKNSFRYSPPVSTRLPDECPCLPWARTPLRLLPGLCPGPQAAKECCGYHPSSVRGEARGGRAGGFAHHWEIARGIPGFTVSLFRFRFGPVRRRIGGVGGDATLAF